MLSVVHYGQEYIDSARAAIDARVGAYRALAGQVRGAAKEALAQFEALYFTDLVLVLENWFVHRQRALEGKDGNALNEVRLIATSVMSNGGRLLADRQIRLSPDRSVLGLAAGDQIAVREEDFVRLAKAFFAEIEARFR